LRSEIATQLDLDQIRYSTVWEDHRLLEAALRVGPGDEVLSIAGAGCNVLALLLQEPESITAVDMSPAQVALLELNLAGIGQLDHDRFVALLGLRPCEDRLGIYEQLRSTLPASAVAFWDAHPQELAAGVVGCGRLDRFFRTFRTEHLARLWPPDLVERLFDAPDLTTQAALFEREAFTEPFQQQLLRYFGQPRLQAEGRDPAQYRYVTRDDPAPFFLRRFHDLCVGTPLRGNFYAERFLTGTYRDLEQGPPHLRPAEFTKLKGLVQRVRVVTTELEQLLSAEPSQRYDKANLSDVFEYMSADAAHHVFAALTDQLRSGGRIAYWNLLVERIPPASLRDRLVSLTAEADDLWRQDRVFFYQSFHIEERRP
jgi:S-adenosylmethionine-diacylglycerol 3-amino-3-carboxypropyl transferase